MVNVFLDRSLFPKSNGDWSEWEVECITSILRILYKFSMESTPSAQGEQGAPVTVALRIVPNRLIKSPQAELLVPNLDMVCFGVFMILTNRHQIFFSGQVFWYRYFSFCQYDFGFDRGILHGTVSHFWLITEPCSFNRAVSFLGPFSTCADKSPEFEAYNAPFNY